MALISLSITIDSVYGLFLTHLAWRLFAPSLFLSIQSIARFSFVMVGIAFWILAWRFHARWGYAGILFSLIVFIGLSYGILWYLGVH